jgi:coenzyme F420-reducing hydrogenase beta subunit
MHDFGKLNELCDIFVVGSDQVWNWVVSKNFGKTYYLDFVDDDKKRVAYGSSWGHEKDWTPAVDRAKISELFKKFSGISVREDEAVIKARENYGVKAKHVIDPVFLADKKIYDALAEKSRYTEEEPFIATYILDPTPEKREALLHVSKKLGLKLVNMLDGLPWLFAENKVKLGLDAVEDLQVEEWLYYIKNSEFVITDSCHGVAFAALYGKTFIPITNKYRGVIRFQSLARLLRFEDRLVHDPKQIIDNPLYLEPMNIDSIQAVIQSKKKECMKWLKEVLETPNNQSPSLAVPENAVVSKLSRKQCIGCGFCINICPTKAMYSWRDESNSLRSEVIYEKCINCGKCSDVCPEWQKIVAIPQNSVPYRLDEKLCTGCSACVNICPKKALSFQEDVWGYYRSKVNNDACSDCGKCSNVCPALNLPEKRNRESPLCYAVIAADEEVLHRSSSGGFFTLLAENVLEQGGYVVGASWTEDFSVEHIMIGERAELSKIQKSKYLQSQLGDIFTEIKEKLNSNSTVLFSGTPCQVAGLKAYLGQEYENLLLVDLLCGNSPSSLFFKKYIEDSFPEGINKYEFRYKGRGWNADCLKVELKDGSSIVRRGEKDDDYQRVYHNHTMTPPHCEECKYQSVPRFGDLTIGDFWGIGNRDSSIYREKGVSVVLCNNDKAEKFMNRISENSVSLMKKVPLQWLGGNGYAINNSKNFCSPMRDAFYEAIKTMTFSKAVDYAFKPNQGNYNEVHKHSNTPLQFSSYFNKFSFDKDIWEEHVINEATVLLVKPGMYNEWGRYAVLPLCKPLTEGQKYNFALRFKIKTMSKIINFHVKDSGSKRHQIIKTFEIPPNSSAEDWNEIAIEFTPNSRLYDEFMIGASQVSGSGNYIAFDYINIGEANVATLTDNSKAKIYSAQ